jgi:hypothetical protein
MSRYRLISSDIWSTPFPPSKIKIPLLQRKQQPSDRHHRVQKSRCCNGRLRKPRTHARRTSYPCSNPRRNNLTRRARNAILCHNRRVNSFGEGVLGRSGKNAARVASSSDPEGRGARGGLRVVGLRVIAAVCCVREVVADATPLRAGLSVVGLGDSGAAEGAGIGGSEVGRLHALGRACGQTWNPGWNASAGVPCCRLRSRLLVWCKTSTSLTRAAAFKVLPHESQCHPCTKCQLLQAEVSGSDS